MNAFSDQELLSSFASSGEEAPFNEIVRRHMEWVYSAAVRMVHDGHLAQDVTQRVFIALARSSEQLSKHPVLSGWLHRTTRNIAAESIRTEMRRRAREHEAAQMNENRSDADNAPWEEIAPHLDEAVDELAESDRHALFLRYFEKKPATEIADILGISDEAAQKRVQRAVARLRDLIARRGVVVGPGALATALGTNAVAAVPSGLASVIAGALTSASIATVAPSGIFPLLTMTTIQKALVTAALSGAVFTWVYQARQVSLLEKTVQSLQADNAPLALRAAELERENAELSSQLRAKVEAPSLTQAQLNELMRLRDQATRAQTDSQELARLKASNGDRTEKVPDFMTNAFSIGLSTAENWKKKDSAEKLARMREMLQLTDAQYEAIGSVMTNYIGRQSQLALEMLTRRLPAEEIRERRNAAAKDQEAEIQALLTAEQRAEFPNYERAEARSLADASSRAEARQIAEQFRLSSNQEEQLRSRLAEMNRHQSSPDAASKADDLERTLESQKRHLEEKIRLLEGFLSGEQIATYRDAGMNRLRLQASALKMVMPPPDGNGEAK